MANGQVNSLDQYAPKDTIINSLDKYAPASKLDKYAPEGKEDLATSLLDVELMKSLGIGGINLLKGLAQAPRFLDMISGMHPQTMAARLNAQLQGKKLPDVGKEISEDLAKLVEKIPEPKKDKPLPPAQRLSDLIQPRRIAEGAIENLPLMGLFIAATIANPVAGGALMASVEGGEALKNVDEYEKETGQKVPEVYRSLIGASVGIINAALEKTGIEAVLTSYGGKTLVNKLIKSLIAAPIEGGTEFAQEWTQILAEAGYKGDSTVIENIFDAVKKPENLLRSAEAGAIGTVLGGGASIPSALTGGRGISNESQKDIEEPQKSISEAQKAEKVSEPIEEKELVKTEEFNIKVTPNRAGEGLFQEMDVTGWSRGKKPNEHGYYVIVSPDGKNVVFSNDPSVVKLPIEKLDKPKKIDLRSDIDNLLTTVKAQHPLEASETVKQFVRDYSNEDVINVSKELGIRAKENEDLFTAQVNDMLKQASGLSKAAPENAKVRDVTEKPVEQEQINKDQWNRANKGLRAVARNLNINDEQLHSVLKEQTGKESFKDATPEEIRNVSLKIKQQQKPKVEISKEKQEMINALGKFNKAQLKGEYKILAKGFGKEQLNEVLNNRNPETASASGLRKIIADMETVKPQLSSLVPPKVDELVGELIPSRVKNPIQGIKWGNNLKRMGDAGEEIYEATINKHREFSRKANSWVNIIEDINKLIGKGKKNQERFSDIVEGKEQPKNSKERDALELHKNLVSEIAEWANNVGLEIEDRYGFRHRFQPLENYFPHYVPISKVRRLVRDTEIVKQIKKDLKLANKEDAERLFDLAALPEQRDAVIKTIMKEYNADEKQANTLLNKAVNLRNNLVNNIAKKNKISEEQAELLLAAKRNDIKGDVFTHLEKSRLINFPIYDKHYTDNMIKYVMSAADRLAWLEFYGKDKAISFGKGFMPEKLVNPMARIAKANPVAYRIAEKGLQYQVPRWEQPTLLDRALQFWRTVNIFKLATAAIPNAGQTAIGMMPTVGVRDFSKAWIERIWNPKQSKRFGMESGAVLPQIEIQLTEMTKRGLAGKVAGEFLKANFFSFTEANNRIVAALAGKNYAERALKNALKKGYRQKFWENELKKLFGTNYKKLLETKKLTKKDLEIAAWSLSKLTQFSSFIEDLPVSWSKQEQWVRNVVQYKNFQYNQMSLFFNEGIREATKFIKTAGKEGSIGKLTRFMVAIPLVGYITEEVRWQLYKLLGSEREKMSADAPALIKPLIWAINAGGFGLALDLIQAFEFGQRGVISQIVGPSFADALNTAFLLHFIITEPKITQKQMAVFKWASSLNPPARVVLEKLFPGLAARRKYNVQQYLKREKKRKEKKLEGLEKQTIPLEELQ